jgi:hypothetical protein
MLVANLVPGHRFRDSAGAMADGYVATAFRKGLKLFNS